MKNLKVGQVIKFLSHKNQQVYTRKIYSIYQSQFNKDDIRYNTRGHNGGYGCNGFSVLPSEIIKVY